MIVAVTGSRLWPWPEAVEQVLRRQYMIRQRSYKAQDVERMIIVQGEAHDGADLHARQAHHAMKKDGWAVDIKRFPADWERCGSNCRPGHRVLGRYGTEYCPTAGHRRNLEMMTWVAEHADQNKLVFGFNFHNSSGTGHALRAARKLGGMDIIEYKLTVEGLED